VPNSEKRQRR